MGDLNVDPLLVDGLMYHVPVILGAAAVSVGTNEPLWKGLVPSLVDEPHSLNNQLGFPPGEERGLFSACCMTRSSYQALCALRLWSPLPLVVVKDRSQLGYSHWNWKTLPVELVAGAAVSVDRSLKSSEAYLLLFGPAREGRRGGNPWARFTEISDST